MDRNRFVSLLTGSIGHLCKAGYMDSQQRVCRVDGLLGITLSTGEVFLVNIYESFADSADYENSTVQNDCFDTDVDFYSKTAAPDISNVSEKQSNRNLRLTEEEYDAPIDTTGLCMILPTDANSDVQSNKIRNLNNYEMTILRESQTMSNSAAAECYNEQGDLTTLVKVESSDDHQVLHDFNTNCKNEFDFDSTNQKYSNMLEQENLQTMDDKSSVFGQMCAPVNENYNLHTNFSHQNYHNPLQDNSLPSNMYRYSLDPANNSESVLCESGAQENLPINRISTQKKHHLVARHRTRSQLGGKYKCGYDAATMRQCIEFVRTYRMSQREAEKVFQIPRTTIQYKMAQLYPTWIASSRCGRKRKFYQKSEPQQSIP